MENTKHIITVDVAVDTVMLDMMDATTVFDDMSSRSGDVSYDDTSSYKELDKEKLNQVQPFQEVSNEQLLSMIRGN